MTLATILNEIPGSPMKFDDTTASEFMEYLNRNKEKTMAAPTVKKVTHEDVTEYIKLLVEIGGVHSVDDEFNILLKKKHEPCYVKDKDGTETTLKIYHNNRIAGDYLVLNPFKESAVLNPAIAWFNLNLEQKMRVSLLRVMEEVIDAVVDKDEATLLELQKYMTFGPTPAIRTMKDELRKIEPDDFLYVFYDRQKKKGEVQSSIGDPTTQEKYKSRVKPKTWAFACEMFEAIFIAGPERFHEVFNHTSSTLGAPHCETTIRLAYEFFKVLNPICKILGLPDVDMDLWAEHLPYVEKYQAMTKWDDGLRQKPLKEIQAPWSKEVTQVPSPVQAQAVQSPPSTPGPMMTGTGYGTPSRGVPQVIMTPEGMKPIGVAPVTNYPPPMGYPMQQGYPGQYPQQQGYPIPGSQPPMQGYPMPGQYPQGYPMPQGYPPGYPMPNQYPNMSGYPMPGQYPLPGQPPITGVYGVANPYALMTKPVVL